MIKHHRFYQALEHVHEIIKAPDVRQFMNQDRFQLSRRQSRQAGCWQQDYGT